MNILEISSAAKNAKVATASLPSSVVGIIANYTKEALAYDVEKAVARFPSLPVVTGTLCVYDSTSTYFRCGASCTWVVPAGATKAKFELWGPGASSGAACCCGYAPYGMSGAYATTIIDVTPGTSYTLCAGCAYCCYAYNDNGPGLVGSPSYVTGTGLTNFCAVSGCGGILHNLVSMIGKCGITANECKYHGFGNICTGGVCATEGNIHNIRFSESKFYCNFSSDKALGFCGTDFGIPPRSGTMTLSSYPVWTAEFTPAPTVDPATGSLTSPTRKIFTALCCGKQQGPMGTVPDNTRNFPGAGGSPTFVIGGSNEIYGDAGRTGMVKVTWC